MCLYNHRGSSHEHIIHMKNDLTYQKFSYFSILTSIKYMSYFSTYGTKKKQITFFDAMGNTLFSGTTGFSKSSMDIDGIRTHLGIDVTNWAEGYLHPSKSSSRINKKIYHAIVEHSFASPKA